MSAGVLAVIRLLFSGDIQLSGLPPTSGRRSSAVICPCIPRDGRFIPIDTTSASPHHGASRGVSFLFHLSGLSAVPLRGRGPARWTEFPQACARQSPTSSPAI